MFITHRYLVLSLFTVGLFGCADGIDLQRLRTDFAKPPFGSIKDRNAIMAAISEHSASRTALSIGALGLPGASIGTAALEAAGASVELMAGMGTCAATPEAVAAFERVVDGKAKRVDYRVDLKTCSGGKLTGTQAVSIEGPDEGMATQYLMKQDLNEVCETTGKKACLRGALELQVRPLNGQPELLAGWDLEGRWEEQGKAVRSDLRGGLLVGPPQVRRFQALVSVTGRATELSYIIGTNGPEIVAGEPFSLRGTEKAIDCIVAADGSGRCGTDISWTAKDLEVLVDYR